MVVDAVQDDCQESERDSERERSSVDHIAISCDELPHFVVEVDRKLVVGTRVSFVLGLKWNGFIAHGVMEL